MIKICLCLGAAAALVASVSGASAESLAGKVGDKRYPVNLVYVDGNCGDAYREYIAAAGHSAYAQTPRGRGFICGAAINKKSQKAAEEYALKSCAAGVAKFKIGQKGRCQIYVSK